MNGPSLSRFQKEVRAGGLIVFDSSLIFQPPEAEQAESLGIPASQMASELGEPKVANLIMLGALVGKVPLFVAAAIHYAIDELIQDERLRRLNRKALALGRTYPEA